MSIVWNTGSYTDGKEGIVGVVRVDEILKLAQKANTSAIAFICADYQMVRSVIEAAEAVLRCYDGAIRKYHAEHEPAGSLDFLGVPLYARDEMVKIIKKKMELCRFFDDERQTV